MTCNSISSRRSFIESFESRLLFATIWGPTAQLVNQDDALSAYSSITGTGVAVAVIDSGINYNLAPLGGGFGAGHKVVAGYDFVDGDANPMDTDGHGTEVAGVIAADGFDFNGKHYQGVAPDANLVALRVTHGSDGAADDTIKQALDWVITNYAKYNIKVINISLGSGSNSSSQTNSTLSADFAQLAKLDILVFAASGNSGDSIFGSSGIAYPAADPSVVSVGAVNASDTISTFTQRASNLDLLAPGEAVPTTSLGGGFSAVDGTSFASPYAAGAAALVRQYDSTLSGQGALSILRASGAANKDGDTETGQTTELSYPRLDILAALNLAAKRKTNSRYVVGTGANATDIAYDAQGVMYLAYYDPAIHSIRFATRGTSGLWSRTQIIDTSVADVGVQLSIAVDSTGKPGVAYFDNTNSDLKYAHFNGTSWDVTTRDSNKSVGQFPALAYDSQGDPVIAYYRKSGADLKLQTFDANGNWIKFDVDSTGDVGQWASVSVASSGGIVAVSYNDATNGDLKYARYADGQWTIFTVDNLSGGVGYVSLNIHNNQAFISYQDLANGDLKFAKRENGQWYTETVYTPGNTGQWSSLVFDANNTAHVAFYSKSKKLTYQAIGNFGSWTVKKVGTGGIYLTAASTWDGNTLDFVALDALAAKLQFGLIASL